MKRCIGGSLLAACCMAAAALGVDVQVGDPETRVYDVLGEPRGTMNVLGRKILTYGGGNVEIQDGLVVHVDEDFDRRVKKRELEKKRAAQAAAEAGNHPGVLGKLKNAKQWAQQRFSGSPSQAGNPAAPPPGPPASSSPPQVKVISNGGQTVEINQVLEPGRVTIVDFYADWCGPCKTIAPHLEQMANRDDQVVLRKIDIVNWDTPVARQYGLRSIPSIWVFNAKGQQVGQPTSDLRRVMQFVSSAK